MSKKNCWKIVVNFRKMRNNILSGNQLKKPHARACQFTCPYRRVLPGVIMNTAITIGDALLLLVGVCVVILLIYMIRAVKNIIPAFKALSGILEDTQVVTGMVSSASKEVEDAVSSLSESSVDMAHFISENKNSFKAAVSLINALVAIKKLFS